MGKSAVHHQPCRKAYLNTQVQANVEAATLYMYHIFKGSMCPLNMITETF